MQSRSFFSFGASFNILVDSLYVAQPKLKTFPADATHLVTELSEPLITEDSNNLIIE
jgi:hypothetical protein